MNNVLSLLPFNIGLLVLTPEHLRGMKQIKVLDIFEGSGSGSKAFHPEGLFSTEIYGKVGDERRNRLYGYIDLRLGIFHPVIYKALVDLKELYGGILAGTSYAVFNKETKDFEAASLVDGETGYTFFLKYFKELKFEERPSTAREFAIKMVYKYRDTALMDKLLVMPAGLRDFTILPNGKPEEDEINTLYRRVLSTANVIGQHSKAIDTTHMDSTRHGLQMGVNAIYDYIINLLEGKTKLIQGWWTSRKIFQSTRNVITSNVPKVNVLFDKTAVGPNHTVAGIYQCLRAIFPLAVNLIREMASQVFTGPNTPANLVNRKTFEREVASVPPEYYDEWMTQEGLEQTIGRFEVELLRQEPIEIDGRWFGLIYNDGKVVRFCQGIEELPEGFDKKYLSPITYAELFYLAIFEKIKHIPAFLTRYPITGYGSIYPCWIYMKTTTRSQCLKVLGPDWKETESVANEFPIKGVPFVNSMSPGISHLTRLTADFDGDVCSLTAVMSDEGIDEIKELLSSKDYYVGVNGQIVFSSSNDVSDLVFAEMTT